MIRSAYNFFDVFILQRQNLGLSHVAVLGRCANLPVLRGAPAVHATSSIDCESVFDPRRYSRYVRQLRNQEGPNTLLTALSKNAFQVLTHAVEVTTL